MEENSIKNVSIPSVQFAEFADTHRYAKTEKREKFTQLMKR